jgi:hypothetical protein
MGFEDDLHPRDSDGRFIETGGEKLKAWGKARPKRRESPDEAIPKVGDFMREAIKASKANPGGFTVRPGYSMPKTGTIVSLPTSAGLSLQIAPGERLSRKNLRDWVKKARAYLRSHDDTYIGGWKSEQTGVTYFDVNERWDHEKALELGRHRNQEGVFRLDDFSYHPTGGSGK